MRSLTASLKNQWSASAQELEQQAALAKDQPVITFTILPSGEVSRMRLTHPTKVVALDRAAWRAITETEFVPLPKELTSPLELRASFIY
jgi:TonB family protein